MPAAPAASTQGRSASTGSSFEKLPSGPADAAATVAMISSMGTTASSVRARYGAAVLSARAMVSGMPCSPSTPSTGAPGAPYSATKRRPGKRV
jgi:hypothetical protein